MKRISRVGSYGLLVKERKVALVTKVKGPYTGLLDLPGGKIEFGESSLDALKREIREELALEAFNLSIYSSYSYLGAFNTDSPFQFHHLGVIYQVKQFKPVEGAIPEDKWDWYSLDELSEDELTPFAQQAITSFR